MDGLCELTSRSRGKKTSYEIPDPDYDLEHESHENGLAGIDHFISISVDKMERAREEENVADETSLTPEQIRRLMSKEQKELQKDLKIMQRRGMDLQSKRPEFKSKHHEIMAKGASRKELEQNEQSELNAKLKSRSDVINQANEAKKQEEAKPEFMKILLKKGRASPAP